MESKREKLKREAVEFIYGAPDAETFVQAQAHGAYNKIGLQGITRCYQRTCSKDPDMVNLLDAVLEYAKINPKSPSSYDNESLLLDYIIRYAGVALASSLREYRIVKKELAFYRKNSGRLQAEEKKKNDAQGLLKFERAETSVVASYAFSAYFNEIAFGSMSASECPEELFHEFDPEESALGHPVFSHSPLGVDITDAAREDSPFFVGLSNYAKKESESLIGMFCDCGEGVVMVRLWDPETAKPVCVSVEKDDVYFDWIVVGQNPALWPGLICRALEQRGYDVMTADPKLLMQVISGKKDVLSAEDLTRFVPESAKKTPDAAAFESYFRCLNDLCIAMLGTMNVNIQETAPPYYLFEAIKTVIGAVFDNFSDNLELLRPAMEYLQQKTKEYREFADPSQRRKRRLEICDSIDQLIEIYNDPDLRYAPARLYHSLIGQTLK